jgi:hypothetical protein
MPEGLPRYFLGKATTLGRKRMRTAAVVVAASAVTVLTVLGCAQPAKFEKAGVSAEVRKTDIRECVKAVRNKYPPPLPGAGYGVEAGIAQGLVEGDRIRGCRLRLYDECMTKRG